MTPWCHHIFEILLACVFSWPKVTVNFSPNFFLFKRLKICWETVVITKYSDFRTEVVAYEVLRDVADQIKLFAKNKFKEEQPRDDYRELLHTQLTLGKKLTLVLDLVRSLSFSTYDKERQETLERSSL